MNRGKFWWRSCGFCVVDETSETSKPDKKRRNGLLWMVQNLGGWADKSGHLGCHLGMSRREDRWTKAGAETWAPYAGSSLRVDKCSASVWNAAPTTCAVLRRVNYFTSAQDVENFSDDCSNVGVSRCGELYRRFLPPRGRSVQESIEEWSGVGFGGRVRGWWWQFLNSGISGWSHKFLIMWLRSTTILC